MRDYNLNLDEVAILRLELMDQLISCKNELEQYLKDGYFMLGKARYIMGVNAVSELKIPTDEHDVKAICTVASSKEPLMTLPLTNYNFLININEHRETEKDIDSDSTNVRKRRVENEAVRESGSGVPQKINNPINWFSALPPQCLRKAQQSFRQAILKSAECATIQSKLDALCL